MSNLIDEDGTVIADDRVRKVRTALEGQHAIHGILGSVFERLGGEDFIYEWAKDHEGAFIKMLVGATPGMAPTTGFQGDVTLHIHQSLGVSALDDAPEESGGAT